MPTDFQNVINTDEQARKYYLSLPEYLREIVSHEENHIQSYEELKRHADYLMEHNNYADGDFYG